MAQTENFWHLRLAIDFHQYCPMSNHPVEIVKDFSIAQAEEILRRLSKRPDSVLRLPLRLDRPKFAARSSLNQLLITWAKQGRVREIQTYLGSGVTNEGISEQFLRMRDQGFGIIAGLLAKRILGQGGQDLTQKCRDHLLKYLDATHNRTRTSNKVSYWGDMDDVGFRILSGLRHAGLVVESIFMDDKTWIKFSELAHPGNVEAGSQDLHLNDSELSAWKKVREKRLMLEQELLPQNYIERELAALFVPPGVQ